VRERVFDTHTRQGMRHTAVLLRGRTPPPPPSQPLTSSLPASSLRKAKWTSSLRLLIGVCTPLESTADKARNTSLRDGYAHAAAASAAAATEMGGGGLQRSPGVAVRSAFRAVSLTSLRSGIVCRAFSPPLRTSARSVSSDAHPTASVRKLRGAHKNNSAEEEMQTSFHHKEDACYPAAAVSSAQRPQFGSSRGSRNHSQQPLLQRQQASSAMLLDRSADTQRRSRYADSLNRSAAATGVAQASCAESAARLMRRHRLHSSLPYLVIASGVEVPGCSGGAYHLQERLDLRSTTGGTVGGAKATGYASRLRSGGNNVRMSVLPYSRSSHRAAASSTQASPQVLLRDAAYARLQDYEPFERLFRRYVERGHVLGATQRLLHHPDAPAPVVLLDRLLQHRVPAPSFVLQALLAAMHAARPDRSTSAAATFALERVVTRLRTDATCRLLYDTPEIRALLLEATLRDRLFDVAVTLAEETPDAWITPHAWSLLVQAAGQSKLPHSQLLWRLMSVRDGTPGHASGSVMYGEGAAQQVLTRAGESALLRRVPLCRLHGPAMPAAPPTPPNPPSSASASAAAGDDANGGATTSSSSSVPRGSLRVLRSVAPSSELPLAAAHIPDTVFEARTCSTVLMPTHASTSTAHATEALTGADAEEGNAGLSSSPPSSSSALVPSTFNTEGVRWCALGPVDMGYAVEHYDGDTAAAAGDFRAVGAAGVLHSFSSFQSLFAEVEEGVRRATGSSSSPSLSSRAARRALWETTALRMIHHHRGIVYGLDAATTARVLLRCGVGFSGQASPLLALNVLRRYLRSCHLLRDEIVRAQELIEAQLDAEEGPLHAHNDSNSPATSATDVSSSNDNAKVAVEAVTPRLSANELVVLYPRLARAVAPHPSPFLVFFKVMREAREVLSNAVEEEGVAAAAAAGRNRATTATDSLRTNNSLPMVHWELVWHVFQQLNRENSRWHTQMTVQEAGDLCQDVVAVLCHGADPWLTLNVARRVSVRHIVDGVDMSLWLLHRLDPSHHTEEAREVARKLFRWLLVDVGLHLQPSLHHHLIPAARALIRLGLQEELRLLYSAVLDNVYLFRPEHRDAFMQVLSDLICPACATILPESDVYVDRACPNCMAVVPAKDADTIPSFRLSAEHVERLRARRKQQRQRSRQRLAASVHRLQSEEHDGEANTRARRQGPPQLRGPQDAADVLRRHLQKSSSGEDGTVGDNEDDGVAAALLLSGSATLVPGVSVASDVALFPLLGSGNDASVLDLRAAMEESSRRLELQRAARRYILAQRGELDDDDDDRRTTSTSSSSLLLTRRTPAAMPTTLPISAQALDAATLKYLSTAASAGAQAALERGGSAAAAHDGVWVCVWCQERNTEWSSRVQCSACGAETGPSAPWRHFAYADPVTGDVMTELRGRMSNGEERPVDAIVAGYMLMIYRRTFQLRATPSDHELLQRLITMLCRLQERVLAGYVYTRIVPPSQRHLGPLLDLLAQTHGQDSEERYRALTPEDVTRPEREGIFFDAVFGPQTCRVCFGSHDWHVCPIVTRDFAGSGTTGDAAQHQQPLRSPIRLSPEEKQRAVLERLSHRIQLAAQSAVAPPGTAVGSAAQRPNAQLVVDAYTAFVSSPFREVFAELHAEDTNQLSLLLSRMQQYRRAAFVLCHIPLTKRSTAAYLQLVHFFNVTEEEALALLERPSTSSNGTTSTSTVAAAAPNFVQVTKTCCMCLDQRHASHECPRLGEWLKGVQRLAKVGSVTTTTTAATKATTALVDSAGEARLRQRLRAQVDGWTTAGPERLHAFYRYLEKHMELLRLTPRPGAVESSATPDVSFSGSSEAAVAATSRRVDFNDPLVYAVNKTVTKLATMDRRSEAYRLYAHAPVECVSTATTTAMLRMNGFSEDSICALLNAGDAATSATSADDAGLMTARSSSSASALSTLRQHAPPAARAAAVPVHRCCLLCFSPSHAYVDCPELAAAATEAEKLLLVVRGVGGITCVHDGIGAAAAYVYSEYNRGRLSGEMMRSSPGLVAALLTLARRCFATHQLSHGVRVLRRIPVEMVPPAAAYTDLWRAAGLPDEEVEQKQAQLLALFDAEGLAPCVDPAPPRPTYTNSFLSRLSRTLHDGVCRHCYEHGHTIATCPLFHSEVSFGRDYVAAYRMSMMSEQLDRAWQEAYLLKLVDFFSTHYLFMPYHIAGVANALNAITAMWSFRGEPGIALHNLLLIPPAYRRRQAFKHVLHCLRVPSAEITRLLGDFYFAPDSVGGSNSTSSSGNGSPQQQQQQEMMMAQHLLIPKPAIRDVARRQIFEQLPAAMTALEESTERMAQIRANHERRGAAAASPSMPSSSGLKKGISAHIKQTLEQQQQPKQEHSPFVGSDGVAASSFYSPILRCVMQSGGMAQLREDFDPILAELEDAVGMRLGSRHTLFTSAIDILGTAAAAATAPAASTTTGDAATGCGVRGSPTSIAAQQPSMLAAPAGSAARAPAASSARRSVQEAEVVVQLHTQPVPPSTSSSPSSAGTPNRVPPSSAPHLRQPRPSQQQQQRRHPPSSQMNTSNPHVGHKTSGATASPASASPTPRTRTDPGEAQRAFRAADHDDEDVRSSFPVPSTRASTRPPPPQSHRTLRATGSNSNSSTGNNTRQTPRYHRRNSRREGGTQQWSPSPSSSSSNRNNQRGSRGSEDAKTRRS
jgi:hypothetical protein